MKFKSKSGTRLLVNELDDLLDDACQYGNKLLIMM